MLQTDPSIGIVPRDGVRQRLHAVLGERRLHLELDRDGFAAEQPISSRVHWIASPSRSKTRTRTNTPPCWPSKVCRLADILPRSANSLCRFAWKETKPREFNCHCLPDWGPRFVSNPTQLPTKRFPLLRGPGYFLTALRDTPCAAGDTQAWVE